MTYESEVQSRLATLRAKTDRELGILIERRLEVGLTLARSLAKDVARDQAPPPDLRRDAEQACNEAEQLMTVLPRGPATNRPRLESRRRRLRRLLDGLCESRMRVHSACC